jgi:hypothetical protein
MSAVAKTFQALAANPMAGTAQRLFACDTSAGIGAQN